MLSHILEGRVPKFDLLEKFEDVLQIYILFLRNIL